MIKCLTYRADGKKGGDTRLSFDVNVRIDTVLGYTEITGDMARKWEREAEEMLENVLLSDAAYYMDDEIRDAIHIALAPCEDVEFLAYYMAAHYEKYAERFTIN